MTRPDPERTEYRLSHQRSDGEIWTPLIEGPSIEIICDQLVSLRAELGGALRVERLTTRTVLLATWMADRPGPAPGDDDA